jgi:DNA-binding response OmpR family regulator
MSEQAESKRVLVVEDDEPTRLSIIDTLDALGFDDVTAVATGAGAVNALIGNPGGYEIAIVDIFLTDMTAKHMARQFPENHGIKTLILFSGGGGDSFAAVRSEYEKLDIPNVQSLKKPATLDKFKALLG